MGFQRGLGSDSIEIQCEDPCEVQIGKDLQISVVRPPKYSERRLTILLGAIDTLGQYVEVADGRERGFMANEGAIHMEKLPSSQYLDRMDYTGRLPSDDCLLS